MCKKLIPLIILALCLSGCATSSMPKPEGFPDLASCVITVTQDGAPLAGAHVALVPSDGGKDWMAVGETDASGKAVISTYGQAQGAPLGKYKVVITQAEVDEASSDVPEQRKSYSFIELQYTKPESTPHEITVEGKTTGTFDVGKKVRELVK